MVLNRWYLGFGTSMGRLDASGPKVFPEDAIWDAWSRPATRRLPFLWGISHRVWRWDAGLRISPRTTSRTCRCGGNQQLDMVGSSGLILDLIHCRFMTSIQFLGFDR